MDGIDEGLFSWFTVNFLLGNVLIQIINITIDMYVKYIYVISLIKNIFSRSLER